MDNDTVIEISNVWKIFGSNPEVALQAIRDRGLSKAEVLAEYNCVVGVAAIAQTAGVNKRMIYHYFGSKDALYRACVDAMYDELVDMRPRLIEALREGGILWGWPHCVQQRALTQAEGIYGVIRQILEVSQEEKIPTHEASNRIAERRIHEVGQLRRRFVSIPPVIFQTGRVYPRLPQFYARSQQVLAISTVG